MRAIILSLCRSIGDRKSPRKEILSPRVLHDCARTFWRCVIITYLHVYDVAYVFSNHDKGMTRRDSNPIENCKICAVHHSSNALSADSPRSRRKIDFKIISTIPPSRLDNICCFPPIFITPNICLMRKQIQVNSKTVTKLKKKHVRINDSVPPLRRPRRSIYRSATYRALLNQRHRRYWKSSPQLLPVRIGDKTCSFTAHARSKMIALTLITWGERSTI